MRYKFGSNGFYLAFVIVSGAVFLALLSISPAAHAGVSTCSFGEKEDYLAACPGDPNYPPKCPGPSPCFYFRAKEAYRFCGYAIQSLIPLVFFERWYSEITPCDGDASEDTKEPPSTSLSSPDVVSTPPDTDLTKQGPQADVKLTWSSTNASSCTASSAPSVPAWNGSKTTSSTQTLKLSGGTYDFSLTCTGEGGSATATSSTRVVSLDLWGQDSVYKPDSFYLDWATHHILSPLTKSSSPSNPKWQGTASSSSPDGRRMSALLDSELFQRGTTTFSLTGTGLTKTVTDTHRIRFYEIPRCSFSANPTRIVLPNSSTLSWECKYANSCSIDQGIGTVSPRTGSLSVRPPRTTTYTLSCSGPDGGNSFQTTVSVGFHGRLREIFPLKLEDPADLLAQAMDSISALLSRGTEIIIRR